MLVLTAHIHDSTEKACAASAVEIIENHACIIIILYVEL